MRRLGLANPMFRAALAGKTANWVGPVNTPHEFVYVPDTGPVIVDLASRAECYGEAWNFGGAATINTMDFITRIYRAVGARAKYRTVGAGMLKFLGWFNPDHARSGRDAVPAGDAGDSGRQQADGETAGAQDALRRWHPANAGVDAGKARQARQVS